jgi:hypothetical protein
MPGVEQPRHEEPADESRTTDDEQPHVGVTLGVRARDVHVGHNGRNYHNGKDGSNYNDNGSDKSKRRKRQKRQFARRRSEPPFLSFPPFHTL